MARPSRYTTKLGDAICKRIAKGESLRKIGERSDMPSAETIRRWLASESTMYAGFRGQYARAREEQADHYADQIIEIADEANEENAVALGKAKLRIEARKWKAAKLAPKKWGTDRIEHAGDEDAPLTVRIARVNTAPKGDPAADA